MNKQNMVSLLIMMLLLAGCAAPRATATPGTATPAELVVMVHDSFAVSEGVVNAFEQANGVKVTFLKSGDAGAALNRAILTKDNPSADVLYGVDNTFLSRALDAGIFEPYTAPELADIPAQFKLDGTFHALPVDYGDVCINIDRKTFADRGLALPASLQDLTRPEYKGLLVVENPATSSPGLAFLLATVAQFGPQGAIDYWKQLRANDVVVAPDWNAAYYTHFSGSSGKGAQAMVVSYSSSPAAEVIFADPRPTEAPTLSLNAPGMCFRQIEFVGILKGTQRRTLAEKFVSWMLSRQFQEDMPLQMFVYPVNSQANLPAEFTQWAQPAQSPAQVAPADIAANREAWIQAWDEAVLR